VLIVYLDGKEAHTFIGGIEGREKWQQAHGCEVFLERLSVAEPLRQLFQNALGIAAFQIGIVDLLDDEVLDSPERSRTLTPPHSPAAVA